VFSFAIDSVPGVPPDFILPPDLEDLTAGVFLPQGGTGWFGRREYPARVVLSTEREVVVAAHPAAGEPPARVPINRIECVERGRALLVGWIALWWDGGILHLPYNTGNSGAVDAFMVNLLNRWLPENTGAAAVLPAGAALEDLKFKHARSAELLTGEAVLLQFFQPGNWELRRAGMSRRRARQGGELVAVTSRRVLWITERRRGRREPYGTISRSAPLAVLRGVRSTHGEESGELEFVVGNGRWWRVPVARRPKRKRRNSRPRCGGCYERDFPKKRDRIRGPPRCRQPVGRHHV
jgi:hypothetical protein